MKNISQVKKLEKCSKYLIQVSKDGIMKESSKLLEQTVDIGCTPNQKLTNSLTSKKKRKLEDLYAMPELVVKNKKETLKDKPLIYEKNIQPTKLLKTSDQGLIGKGKGLQKWWTQSSKEISKKLWLPTKIDCVELDLNSWNKSAKRLTRKSWFSTTFLKKKMAISQKTSFPLLPSLLQDIMGEELHKNEKREPKKKKSKTKKTKKKKKPLPTHCIKIRMYPSLKEKEMLKKWMGTYRWTYNKALDAINKKGSKINKKELRQYCVALKSTLLQENTWVKNTPNAIRDSAICDLLKAFKTCFSKGDKFKMKFKSKRKDKDTIPIEERDFKRKRGAYQFISKIKVREKIPEVKHAIKISKDSLNRFWFCIPIVKELKKWNENQVPKKVIALDPGIRTFMTSFSNDESCIEFGKSDVSRIYRLGLYCDKLQSRWTKVNHKKRYRLKKAYKRIHCTIRNLVKELHCKVSKYLCLNYDLILLPSFKTQTMSIKGKRKISAKNVRKMITLSHYQFQQRLIHKAKEYGKCVKIVEEEYTSKTCSRCGFCKNNLGSAKIYNCDNCHLEVDRDINGARNILIKELTHRVSVGSYPL